MACGSATLRQPALVPVLRLLWLRAPLPDFPVRASAADAFTGVLLTDFAAARQFISAGPYCLSGLREKLYPCNCRMSTPATIDFAMFEAEVICSPSRGKPPPVKIQPSRPEVVPGFMQHLAARVGCDPDTLPPGAGRAGIRELLP